LLHGGFIFMQAAIPQLASQRLFALDAARGIAMLLVCVSHFLDVYVSGGLSSDSMFVGAVILVCRAATPTFVLISGVLLGYHIEARGAQFAAFRTHLLDRALFVATVGHILISLSLAARRSSFASAMAQGQITDTIAFCVMIGVFLVPTIGNRLRLMVGLCLAIGSWFAWQFWNPEDPLLQFIKRIALGPTLDGRMVFLFPLLPWLGLYLAGSAAGGWLKCASSQDMWLVSRRLIRISLAMITTALALKAGFILRTYLGGVALEPGWYQSISPYQKYPPSPFYLVLFGGIALLLLSVLFSLTQPSWMKTYLSFLEPIGRNAFPIFVVQFFLYYTLFYLFATRVTMIAPVVAMVLLPLSLIGVWAFARLCQQYKVSRFLTLGIPLLLPLPTKCSETVQRKYRHAA
jgi:uncharacterized membrane protein